MLFLASFLAIPYSFVYYLPRRLYTLLFHLLFTPFKKVSRSKLNFTKYKPSQIQLMIGWILGLLLRTVDIFEIWKIIEFLFLLFKPKTRKLNSTELTAARLVFKDSINYNLIRIDENSALAKYVAKQINNDHLGFVSAHTINFSRKLNSGSKSDMAWLIHEITHVSQFEKMGFSYTFEAVFAQKKWGYAYKHLIKSSDHQLNDFNLEQQADIARDFFLDNENQKFKSLINQVRLKAF